MKTRRAAALISAGALVSPLTGLSRLLALMTTFVWLFAASPATAALITFDELDPCLGRPGCPDPGDPIPNGYRGLNWSMHAMNATASIAPPTSFAAGSLGSSLLSNSGYFKDMVSGPNVAYPNNCCDADSYGSFSSASPFTLISLYLGAAWRSDLNVDIWGYSDGTLTHAYTAIVGMDGPTFLSFGWADVDSVVFHSYGGAYDHDLRSDGSNFVLDDVSVDFSSVPLPATLPLFASGLAGLGWLSRRRKRNSLA